MKYRHDQITPFQNAYQDINSKSKIRNEFDESSGSDYPFWRRKVSQTDKKNYIEEKASNKKNIAINLQRVQRKKKFFF